MVYSQIKLLLPHDISGDVFGKTVILPHKNNGLKIYDICVIKIKPP